MIIDFRRKNRKITTIMIMGIILIGGLFFLNKEYGKPASNINLENISSYKMDVILDDESKGLICNQTVNYINNTKQDLKNIYFHIYPNAFSKEEYAPFEKSQMNKAYPNGFNEGYIDIKNILIQNQKAKYNIEGNKEDILKICLDKPLKRNQPIEIDIKYRIKLPNSVGRFGYGKDTINITNWFPIACVYDDKGWNTKSYETIGDPFYSDISNYNVTILAPSKYKIGSTGKVISYKTNNKKSMYNIEAKKVRDFAFILSDKFNIKKDYTKNTEIITYNLDDKLSALATTISKDSIDIFSNLFGKYPYNTYSVIASDFYIGGMEYPTLSMIDKTLYNPKNKFLLEYVIAHETAHQWWYSAVGNDEVNEPWLDEALTEYSTVLYFENKYGKETARKLIRTMEKQSKSYSSKDIFKPSNKYKNSIDYSINVYTKGAVVIDNIRKEVGDKVFFKVLRQYFETYKFENANTKQFMELWKNNGVDIDKIIKNYK